MLSNLFRRLRPAELRHQDVETTEPQSQAGEWLQRCWDRKPGRALINDHVSRGLLEQAALVSINTGFCNRTFLFDDGSKLVINEREEIVL